MATQKEAMVTSRSETARTRFIPSVQLSVLFAQAGSIKTLPVGTVVSFNTSTGGYVEWATGGANGTGEVQGIVNPDPVEITTAGEVFGSVMLKGQAHFDDLVTDGGTSAQLKTALQSQALARGLIISGVADMRQ